MPSFILATSVLTMDFYENHHFGEEKSARLKETLAMPTGDTPKELLSMWKMLAL